MIKPNKIAQQMNDLGILGKPFVFIIDFEMKNPIIIQLKKSSEKVWFQIPGHSNSPKFLKNKKLEKWEAHPITFKKYNLGFDLIKHHINNGDTYLLNYTQPTPIDTNLTLKDIFQISSARYKIYLKNKFVCFSPETFIKIEDDKILSFPMKGTIDAGIENAKNLILNDSKEIAEHNTIVDLIRNDLSLVAENVTVDKFRYFDLVRTHQKNLWQVSSQISGSLPKNYTENIGDIIFTMLPAGSISGAPKKKTVKIIQEAENYYRGFYTGIFGVFDGKNMDSCVLIRYIENQNGQLIYKSGGGITFMSEAEKEYEEMLKKVYVPIA